MKFSEINMRLELIKTFDGRKLPMFQTHFLLLIFALMLSVAGCSSTRVLVQPLAVANQSVSYDRGQLQLKSETPHPIGMTIVDYSEDEMIIEVSVANTGDDPFDFSDKNVKGKIVSPDRNYPVNVLGYDAFLKNRSDTSETTWKRTGSTAISVGSSFIPYGGIASSVAQLLYSLGQETRVSLQDLINAQSYLRRHTVDPNTDYGGLLKVSLPKQLESGDVLMFQISSADEIQDFSFICR